MTNVLTRTLTALGALLVSLAGVRGEEPAPVKLDVYPPTIELSTRAARQSVVVQATYADASTRDVTAT